MSPAELAWVLRLMLAGLLLAWFTAALVALGRAVRATAAPPPATPTGYLRVVESPLAAVPAGRVFPLLALSAIGRAPTSVITLPDDTISLEHALLYWRNGQWWLEDLGSHNGTRLNGVPVIHPTPLTPSDLVGIGPVILQLLATNPTPPPHHP